MDRSQALAEHIRAAAGKGKPLCIRGGGSKSFYGREPAGEPLDVSGHRGIVNYQPEELILTVRCGTPLHEVETTLAAQNQMLPFEPPHFGPQATVGGAVACGLSGPRRAGAGALRDYILGVRCINGRGEILRFGGEVVKNVAGFDAARLMAGALGTLGVLLDVTFKVLPRPAAEHTLAFEMDEARAIETMNRWAAQPLPLSASSFHAGRLCVRLSGSEEALAVARRALGGETLAGADDYWQALREHRLTFFAGTHPLWRLSVPPATPPLKLGGEAAGNTEWFLEWHGAQRWFRLSPEAGIDAETLRRAAAAAGGHATLFRHGERRGEVFHPLPPALLALHKRLKAAFDPDGVLNPGRLYPAF